LWIGYGNDSPAGSSQYPGTNAMTIDATSLPDRSPRQPLRGDPARTRTKFPQGDRDE
jgi:hypothetical protein